MDPLQLEESNDASDAAAALMCRAAENVAAALKPSTPYKTDQTLENDLISECMRLDAPSVEKTVQLQKRYIDLFGEDSNNPNEPTPLSTHAGLMPSTPKTTKEKTRKPRRTALNASNPVDSPANSGCARAQGYSASPKSDRRKSQRRSNSKNPTEEEEDIIQEVLAMAKASTTGVSEPQRKRKHRSDSINPEKNPSTRHDSNDNNISEDQKSTDKTQSPNVPSPNSSNQDIEVVEIAEPVANIPKKNSKTNKTLKEAGKRSAREAAKPYSIAGSSFESRKTPIKLFKSSITSSASFQTFRNYRQSAGATKKSPHNASPKVTTAEPVTIPITSVTAAEVTSPEEVEPEEVPSAKVTSAEVALAEAAPAEVAQAETAPAEVAPAEVAPAEAAPAEAAPAEVAPASAPSMANSIVVPPPNPEKMTSRSPVLASKEKSRRSTSKHQTYLKMSSLSTVSPKISPAVSSVATQPNNTPQPKTPASSSRQRAQPTQKEAIVIHKDLVSKIRKELRLSKEFDIYSQ